MKVMHGLFLMTVGMVLLSCTKGNNEETTPDHKEEPTIIVKDAIVKRQNTAAICRFYVDLSDAYDKEVTVKYATEEGTAKAGNDFTAKSGKLTFAPGKTEKTVDIDIKQDSLRRSDQKFYLTLSDPNVGKLEKAKGTGTIVNNGTYLPTDSNGYTTPKSYPGYHLAWSDEFDEQKLNEKEWNYEKGNGSNGWGNNELEYYTSRPENVFLSSGNLIIEARKEDYNGSEYTSARLTTQGKKEFTYGRIDIRAKLPVDHGIWPALWMLGSNISEVGWPECGETDIMEVIGKNPSQVVGSLHWKKTDGNEGTISETHQLSSGDFSDAFHVFSLIWNQDSLQILVDDIPYMKASRTDMSDGVYPFDGASFFIFNVAVGGDWPGAPDKTTSFPQRMFVDYVRVFQKQ